MEKTSHTQKLRSYLDIFKGSPINKKVSLVLAASVGLVSIVLLVQMYRASGYQLLYGSLEPGEMSTISRWLDNRHISYRKDYGKGDLYVPAERVHEIRTDLAERQYFQYPDEAHELIDTARLAPLGTINENSPTIALQRELARTIRAFDNIRAAQVILGSHRRGASEEQLLNATIVLTPEAGRKPLPAQLQAMSRLVSGAVADLAPERIRIISSHGDVLLRDTGLAGDDLHTIDALSYQRSIEQMLEKRAMGVIEMLIGTGPAHVTVAADINFASSEMIAERFDPDDVVVRKEESSQQITDGSATDPDAQNVYQEAYSGAISSESKLEYEINKTTSKTVQPTGTVNRLTVTLLIPEKRLHQSDSGFSYQPLSEEEIEKIEAAVSAALALKPERGDTIHRSSIPIAESETNTVISTGFSGVDFFTYLPLTRLLLFAALLLLAYLLLIRPILSILSQHETLADEVTDVHEPLAEPEPVMRTEDTILALRQEILSNPSPAAHIVRKWIEEA